MTRKEQKEERRKAILMTALHLFVEKGFFVCKYTKWLEKTVVLWYNIKRKAGDPFGYFNV